MGVIDIILAVLLAMGFYSGFKRGIIASLLSLVGLAVGILAGLKCSHIAIGIIVESFPEVPQGLLPFLGFLLTLFVVILVFRLVAFLIEQVLKAVALNFVNKTAGGIVGVIISAFSISMSLFFLAKIGWAPQVDTSASLIYPYIEPVGPVCVKVVGDVLPVFKDLIEQLEGYFRPSSAAV